jgi:uncharacterized protein YwqG
MNTDIVSIREWLRDRIESNADLAGRDLFSLARPSVRLATHAAPYVESAIGESRIGGVPDVPPGFAWPRWIPATPRQDKFGEPWQPNGPAPLGFIAQIDLSAAPHVDDGLPASGWLYFFYDRYCEPWGYDPADRGCCQVIYADVDRGTLRRAEPPSDLDQEHVAEACLVDMWPELTLPEFASDIEYGTPAYDSYEALRGQLIQAGGSTQHRLLGHPQLIQGPMELECQLASNGVYCGRPEGYESAKAKDLGAGARNWRLLLQIDTDEEGPGWMWGDVGRIYFWVQEQDLAARRFEETWLIFQCY